MLGPTAWCPGSLCLHEGRDRLLKGCECLTPPSTHDKALLEQVVEGFGLLSFIPLMVEDKDSMKQVLASIDKATGYIWGGESEQQPYSQFQYTFAAATGGASDLLSEHQQRYVDNMRDPQERNGCNPPA